MNNGTNIPINNKKAGSWSVNVIMSIMVAMIGTQTAIFGFLGKRFLDQNERLTDKVVNMGEQAARLEERTGGLSKDVDRLDGRVTKLEDRSR